MSTTARLSLAEYDRMIDRGVFDVHKQRRLELFQGELREMNPIGSRHETVVDRLTEWSIKNVPHGKAWIRVQNSIGFPEQESTAQPDIAWVVRRDFSEQRPTGADVLLIIEVAETSLQYDRTEKAGLYAAAEIPDYWIVDLAKQSVEVMRDPAAGRYRQREQFANDDHVRPGAFPELSLPLSTLFA